MHDVRQSCVCVVPQQNHSGMTVMGLENRNDLNKGGNYRAENQRRGR